MDWRRMEHRAIRSTGMAQAEPMLRFAWAARAFAERVERQGIWTCGTDREAREGRAVEAGHTVVAQIRSVAPTLASLAFDWDGAGRFDPTDVRAAFARWSASVATDEQPAPAQPEPAQLTLRHLESPPFPAPYSPNCCTAQNRLDPLEFAS